MENSSHDNLTKVHEIGQKCFAQKNDEKLETIDQNFAHR